MSIGVPVIISDKTQWKHLTDKNIGWDIPLDKITAFAETIDNTAKMKPQDYNLISKSAYDYAQQYIHNPELVEQNRHLFI